jgi:hypothetical protein
MHRTESTCGIPIQGSIKELYWTSPHYGGKGALKPAEHRVPRGSQKKETAVVKKMKSPGGKVARIAEGNS